ncbi:hypothetical protein MNB_SV-3-1247 [hydrothermal vent metagenome]|uniref:Uncharacterized protein n=1 Tax=hydrothermal vent metagenome TaxID=652676 RepID=A0A1W1CXU7_9ZZZZ
MQKREKLFLYNVLNQEIVFEEYFCNLLYIDDFKQLFLKFINSKNTILDSCKIEYENFYTEVFLDEKYGRADLFLKVDSKEFIFEIKNRNWTSLTDNQPSGYLKYLSKYNYENYNRHLFFLIPKSYKHLNEIYKQWNNFDNIDNQIFYWQDFIIEIKKSKLYEQNVEIDMFYQFCLYWFDMKIVKFTEEEKQLLDSKEKQMYGFNNKSIPTLMRKLENIIDDIGSNVEMKRCHYCVGFNYVTKINDYTIYFGIDYVIWENKGMPLNIVIQNHSKENGRFDLKLGGIELEEIIYTETSSTDEEFGYVVSLDEEIYSEDYQHNTIDILHRVLKGTVINSVSTPNLS